MTVPTIPLTLSKDRDPSVVPLHPEQERGTRLTDVGNAERFADQHRNSVVYCYERRLWYAFDGQRWMEDAGGDVERRAKQTVRALYQVAANTQDKSERQAIGRFAMESERQSRMSAMISLAKSEPGMSVRMSQWDTDQWAFNVQNGTIDLRTGQLRPHDRADLLTKLAPVAYDVEAKCDRWEAFLREIFNGNDALIRFMQRAIGYSLTGHTAEQCLFLLYGLGANGKSVLLEVLRRLLGEYARSADFSTFLERKGDGPRNDIARLAGARLVTSSEGSEGRRLSESVIKSMTGGDTMAARFLNAEHFEFAPQFKLFLASNHRPIIRGVDHGIWRRIRLIPFTVQIPAEKQDRNLLDTLTAELPGILAWAVAGCLLWQREGLTPPVEVQSATDEYREEMDLLAPFFEDCCEIGGGYSVEASTLFTAYVAWCDRTKNQTATQQAFGSRLTERGFLKDKKGTVRRIGIRLKIGQGGGS